MGLEDNLDLLEINHNNFNIDFLRKYQHLPKRLVLNYKSFSIFNESINQLLTSNYLTNSTNQIFIDHTHHSLDLSFLKGYTNLQTLELEFYIGSDFSFLNSPYLKSSLRKLSLTTTYHLSDISFLTDYINLTELNLIGNNKMVDVTPLRSSNLAHSIRELVVSNDLDISFLSNYSNLNSLELRGYDGSFSVLDSENLNKSINKLSINSLKLESLSFLEDYKQLQSLKLFQCCKLSDFSSLNSNNLANSIVELELNTPKLHNLQFLSNYINLKKLKLYKYEGDDFDVFDSINLSSSIQELELTYIDNLKDISFLNNYSNLRKLGLSGCANLKDFSILSSPNITNSLNHLKIGLMDITNISFLKSYINLESLTLNQCPKILDFSILNSSNLNHSMKNLLLCALPNLVNLNFLKDYNNLESLSIIGSSNLSDFNGLFNTNLNDSIKSINFRDIPKLDDLSFFKNYNKLESLILNKISVTNLYQFLEYNSVINNNLKELVIQDTVNWLLVKDNKYINQEAMKILQEKGVNISLNRKISYVPKEPCFEDLVDSLIYYLGIENVPNLEVIKSNLNNAARNCVDNGRIFNLTQDYTSGKVAPKVGKIGENVYKVMNQSHYLNERNVYISNLGKFDDFKANLILREGVYNSDLGILVLNDLNLEESKFNSTLNDRVNSEKTYFSDMNFKLKESISKRLNAVSQVSITKDSFDKNITMANFLKNESANNLYDYIDHFMYVLSLFHSVKDHSFNLNLEVPKLGNKQGYLDVVRDFSVSNSKLLIDSRIKNLLSSKIIDEHDSEIYSDNLVPILGDFKCLNTKKGFIIDYSSVRLGHPVEDLSRFLESIEFRLTKEEKTHFINKYSVYRRINDTSFSKASMNSIIHSYNSQSIFENFKIISSKQTFNRDLNDPYYGQRIFYAKNQLNQLSRCLI